MAKVNITNLLKRAEEALNRRNYDLAIFNYIQALSLQPENIEARNKLRATQTRAANENGTSAFKALVGQAKAALLAIMGKKEQAMIALEHAITANPESVGLLIQFAKAAEGAEYVDVAAWQRQMIADRLDPENDGNLWDLAAIYEELGRGAEAVACYEKIMELDPKADVGPAIRNASALMTSDTFATAVEQGSRAVLQDQDEAEFLELDAGKLKTDEQRIRAINYLLEHDVKERPDDHRLYLRLGDICHDMDDWAQGYKDAKSYYSKAQEINATDSTVRDRMGDLEIKALRFELRALQTKVKAGDTEAKKVYKQKNRERITFETKEFERRVKEQPLKAIFHYKLGELYFQNKDYDSAISELQQASRDPKYKIMAFTMLGRSFHSMGQLDMAIDQFKSAQEGQELFEKIRDPLYYEALSLEEKGDLESLKAAQAIYTKIYQIDIKFRDVKQKVPELQQKVKEASA